MPRKSASDFCFRGGPSTVGSWHWGYTERVIAAAQTHRPGKGGRAGGDRHISKLATIFLSWGLLGWLSPTHGRT